MLEARAGIEGPLDRQLISDAMRQLSPGHRAVIERAHYLGWTTGRIADDLKITEAVVKCTLHDALHALRLIFNETIRSQLCISGNNVR